MESITKFDDVASICALINKHPNDFKSFIDEMIFSEESAKSKKKLITNKSEATFFKIVFCYFFELTGIQDAQILKEIIE